MATVKESVCKDCPHLNESIFSGLPEAKLEEFCRLKLVNHYKKDQRIYYEGEPNLGLFILCDGKIKLSRATKLGRRLIMSITTPCGLLEEKDLFIDSRRSVTAEALEDCTVCFIKKEDFLDFLKLNSQLAVNMIRQLSLELEEAEERIEALGALDVKRRLADLLLRLAKKYGRTISQGRLIDIALTREEIAEMLGTTQETVIRALSAFKKERLVKDKERQILLINEERLKRIAEQG